jgi:hypothetical protein
VQVQELLIYFFKIIQPFSLCVDASYVFMKCEALGFGVFMFLNFNC